MLSCAVLSCAVGARAGPIVHVYVFCERGGGGGVVSGSLNGAVLSCAVLSCAVGARAEPIVHVFCERRRGPC